MKGSMPFDTEKLRQIAQPVSESTRIEAEYRKENRDWLRKSAQIAFAVRRELRIQKISQQELAEKMGVSPQYVGRLLKGKENMTLDTISRLEAALNRSILQINVLKSEPILMIPPTPVIVFSSVFGLGINEPVIKAAQSHNPYYPSLS